MSDNIEKLEDLVNVYHNGNITYVKNKLKDYDISFSELFNYYADVHGEILFLEDLKLFVRRLT